MSLSTHTVLLVDPDLRARAFLAKQLASPQCRVIEVADGPSALRAIAESDIRVVVTELYLSTGDDECLIHAIRREKAYRKTRIVAHTNRSLHADREWALRAGADAYLIKPTRAQRMRYVVGRLTNEHVGTALPETSSSPILRRDSLDIALREIEQGNLTGTSAIVFGRAWWEQLPAMEQKAYRKRAKSARVNLRSDSMLGNHFVEVRGRARDGVGLSTERPESPYRR